jgi:hypothetical protein
MEQAPTGAERDADPRYRAYAPIAYIGDAELLIDRLEISGESHYQEILAELYRTAGRMFVAVLEWEPDNPFATNGAAVRVSLVVGGQAIRCGYVPSDNSGEVQPLVKANSDRGFRSTLPAMLYGGEVELPSFGVFLGRGYL